MLKKTIQFEDLDGNPVTRDFWFHLSEAEITKLELSADGNSLSEHLQRLSSSEAPSGKAIIESFEAILLGAYGERDADGVTFNKSPEISRRFSNTNAYSVLFMELVTDSEASDKFVTGLMPKSLQERLAAGERPVPQDHKQKEPKVVQSSVVVDDAPAPVVPEEPQPDNPEEYEHLSDDQIRSLIEGRDVYTLDQPLLVQVLKRGLND